MRTSCRACYNSYDTLCFFLLGSGIGTNGRCDSISKGELHEDVYTSTPEGLNSDFNKNIVCKLRKSLHGLKQSPRQWYAEVLELLVTKLSFESSQNDPCLYVRHTGSKTLIIAFYVDEALIAGNSKSEIADIKKRTI